VLKHAAFISQEENNIPLAKFLGQAHVYFGTEQKQEKKKNKKPYHLGEQNRSQLVTNFSGK